MKKSDQDNYRQGRKEEYAEPYMKGCVVMGAVFVCAIVFYFTIYKFICWILNYL